MNHSLYIIETVVDINLSTYHFIIHYTIHIIVQDQYKRIGDDTQFLHTKMNNANIKKFKSTTLH